MKDTEYNDLLEFIPVNGGLLPANQNAIDLMAIAKGREVITMQNVSKRDTKFHRCYFSLLNYIWTMLPPHFRAKVPCDQFYLFLKMLKGEYDEVFQFKDGRSMVQYHSISFGKMNQQQFVEYVAEQLPIIYEEVIMQIFKSDQAKLVIESIEAEYQKFLSKLT